MLNINFKTNAPPLLMIKRKPDFATSTISVLSNDQSFNTLKNNGLDLDPYSRAIKDYAKLVYSPDFLAMSN